MHESVCAWRHFRCIFTRRLCASTLTLQVPPRNVQGATDSVPRRPQVPRENLRGLDFSSILERQFQPIICSGCKCGASGGAGFSAALSQFVQLEKLEMKSSLLLATLFASIGLIACDRPTVVTNPPAVVNTPPSSSTTAVIPTPGPPGPPGAPG